MQTEIQKTLRELKDILSRIEHTPTMLRGTFSTAYRRCGKPNCRCANPKEQAHPFRRLSWTEMGKQYTRTISESDALWVEKATRAYRQYKQRRKEVKNLCARLEEQLSSIEAQILARTRSERAELGPRSLTNRETKDAS